ncbi:sigma-70 family RNA polymerase sigma factor [Clostridium estertheticum]|uniref:Sigma-70 family RNA polymerase sigma factor n=1 Tax=Clostridium estertheticum TaxID=238834 RepID=A0AA47I7L1_9CLOT|nr:sigma-70 family RNA polymerase sigma factor [Clostridium estertheticum]MBU3155499.1 sigma-70 family RNA polymerase sigma factor [Clostridium estertheticum]MBU3199583.1 sigma-70 family RNA polymerase sigma factor [Clostridium estertheticum]WAG60564.1 sigma-70 family RNA polymerase sigma factor [Clostridium estertheticum]WAG65344.1 sigma-70 family RNA polymerase sigma factor [Clostridium estertheticum]
MKQLAVRDISYEKEITEELCKEEKFANIFEIYYKRVYNYMYYRVNNIETSEDLTSQVFEKVMFKIEIYSKSKSPFEVWMFAIARNIVNDYFRSLKKHKLFSLDTIKDLVAKGKTPEEILLSAESNSELSKALNILNERDRNIVSLKFGANLKNQEIAQILDITESNVGVILYRTMKKLKKKIEEERKRYEQ